MHPNPIVWSLQIKKTRKTKHQDLYLVFKNDELVPIKSLETNWWDIVWNINDQADLSNAIKNKKPIITTKEVPLWKMVEIDYTKYNEIVVWDSIIHAPYVTFI